MEIDWANGSNDELVVMIVPAKVLGKTGKLFWPGGFYKLELREYSIL